ILRAGETLTMDGSTGEVFEGLVAGSTKVVPEAATLREWADELGIAIGEETSPAAPAANRSVSREACLRAIAVKGFAPLEGLADAVDSNDEAGRPIADQLGGDRRGGPPAGAHPRSGDRRRWRGDRLHSRRGAGAACAA